MYIFVAVFVSATMLKENALHKINCVTDCNSIGYTIYNILCNAFSLVGRCSAQACRVTFGRQAARLLGVRSPQKPFALSTVQAEAEAKKNRSARCRPLAYTSLSCWYMLGGPFGATMWRNEYAIEPFKN